MESQYVTMPPSYTNTAAATGTMTLEQLLLWIQQYNLAHPENPIVLDMNTILSAPPQQIKTIIETHINTETHSNSNNDNHDDHDHDHHHKFNWNDLFNHNNHNPSLQQQHEHGQNLGKNPMNFPSSTHDNHHDGKIDYSGGKDDLTHSDDDNPGIPAASDGESDNSGSDGSSNSGGSGSSSSDDSSSGSSSDSGDSGSSGDGDGGGSGSDSGGGGDSSDSNN